MLHLACTEYPKILPTTLDNGPASIEPPNCRPSKVVNVPTSHEPVGPALRAVNAAGLELTLGAICDIET